MKERGMLFSAPMVRALLGGSKTQTRRIVKGERASRGMESGWHLKPFGFLNDRQFAKAACPYGQPGDRLWVRETWADIYGADGDEATRRRCIAYRADGEADPNVVPRWTPAIHMFRWASRITLEITGVRVERLQDISESDAKAEGIARRGDYWQCYAEANAGLSYGKAVNSYASLWESINGEGSWEANPWVWVVEFKRIEQVSP